MEPTLIKNVKKLRDLLYDKRHWTKNTAARNATNNRVTALSHKAVCWCLIGATIKVTRNRWPEQTELKKLLYSVLPENYTNLVYFNDQPKTTHAAIKRLLDRAVKLAETQN